MSCRPCFNPPSLKQRYDYLLRNYTLYRLESTSEIRDDLESVIRRLRPRITAEHGNLVFDGWARMAAPVKSVRVIDVKPPRLDSPAPKSVVCEVRDSRENRETQKERREDFCWCGTFRSVFVTFFWRLTVVMVLVELK